MKGSRLAGHPAGGDAVREPTSPSLSRPVVDHLAAADARLQARIVPLRRLYPQLGDAGDENKSSDHRQDDDHDAEASLDRLRLLEDDADAVAADLLRGRVAPQ